MMPAPAAEPPPPAPDHDPTRRAFFRQFSLQAVSTAGQVAGMATIVNRVTGRAVASLLGLAEPPATGASGSAVLRRDDPGAWVVSPPSSAASPGTATGADPTDAARVSSGSPAADHRFRSPYRMTGQELLILDQRSIPEALAEVSARRGSDVAYYLRLGVARGGALLAQLAALGLAMTALERAAQPAEARDVELRRTAQALRDARPSSRLLGWSVERMERRRAALEADSDGADVAAALRTEAGVIGVELQGAQAAAARALGGVLTQLADEVPERPLGVLLHGDPGALAGGFVGIGLTALRRLRDEGRPARLFVTEGRPFMDGARLASWQLRQAGLEHKVVPDTAVAWLLEHERIDTVLVTAEWVAANGDCGAVLGSRAVALQAAAMPNWPGVSQPAVIACAIRAAIDPATPDGAAIPAELRPARELVAYLAGVPVRAADALVPAADVVPAAALAALVTDRGVVAPVDRQTLALHMGWSSEAAWSSPSEEQGPPGDVPPSGDPAQPGDVPPSGDAPPSGDPAPPGRAA